MNSSTRIERSINLTESIFSEVAQALKDKPVTPLSGDLAELGTIMTDRLSRDFDCVGLDYKAFYPGGLRLRSATVVDCDECWIERRSLSGVEGRSLSGVEGHPVYV
jgi:hypothetical protein